MPILRRANITSNWMPRKTIHIHAPECSGDYWFCQSLEWWARGKCPKKGLIDSGMKRAEGYINRCSNDDIENLNLVCVPRKMESLSNPPPRIGVSESGAPIWKYTTTPVSELDTSEARLPISSPSTDESEMTDCPSVMAAYVKGAMDVGKVVYNECVRAVKEKRSIDREWRLKAAKLRVGNEVFSGRIATPRVKRKIDVEWQAKVDEWEESKRLCRKHYNAWMMMKGCVNGFSDKGEGGAGDDGDNDGSDVEKDNDNCNDKNLLRGSDGDNN